jgi:hypothetical protein
MLHLWWTVYNEVYFISFIQHSIDLIGSTYFHFRWFIVNTLTYINPGLNSSALISKSWSNIWYLVLKRFNYHYGILCRTLNNMKKNSVVWVRERTIPTNRLHKKSLRSFKFYDSLKCHFEWNFVLHQIQQLKTFGSEHLWDHIRIIYGGQNKYFTTKYKNNL